MAKSKPVQLETLLKGDLRGFKIARMTEVFRINEDGQKVKSLGFFKDSQIAEGFAKTQVDAAWHKTAPALVLTNGIVGFVIDNHESVKLVDDEVAKIEVRKKILSKLSTSERAALGITD